MILTRHPSPLTPGLLLCLLGAALAPCHAGSASAHYAILQDSLDAGGGRADSTHYTVEASLGGFGGVIEATATAVRIRQGYPGQLNDPPLAETDTLECQAGQSATVAAALFLANDLDPESDPLSVTAISSPSLHGGVVMLQGQWVSYQPPPGFTGEDTFNYTVSDSLGQPAVGTVRLLILGGNEPPPPHRIEYLGNGRLRIAFRGTPGRLYRIEYAEALNPPHTLWYPLATLTADASGGFLFEETLPAGTRQRFYRPVAP